MKILFLDFDGVLNHIYFKPSTPIEDQRDGFYGSIEWCAAQLERPKVALLNEILEATGAVVVLSTSWRNAHPQNHLALALGKVGFRGFILGCTPIRLLDGARRLYRYDEIQAWLDAAGPVVESFCILDDVDMGPLNENLVKTSLQLGLQPKDVGRAIKVLGVLPKA